MYLDAPVLEVSDGAVEFGASIGVEYLDQMAGLPLKVADELHQFT